MNLNKLGRTQVTTLDRSETVLKAAVTMAEKGVGSIVVLSGGKPAGILTDRDIVVRVVREGLDPKATVVGDVMTADLLTVTSDVEPLEAAARMRARQVRRLPIVGSKGELIGLLTLDDLLHHFGRGLDTLADVIAHFPAEHFGG